MPFGFRKSTRVGPLRFTFSKSGVSTSFGIKGARVSAGPRGTYVTVGSNGFYYRERIDRPSPHGKTQPSVDLRQASSQTEIPTAHASSLSDSSGDEFLSNLNKRAAMWNPAIAAGAGTLLLGLVCLKYSWLLLFTLPAVAGTVWLHRRHVQSRTTRLVYELTEEAERRFSLVASAVQSLASSQRFWRVNTLDHTSDWKRNAGASQLLGRIQSSVGNSAPRFVEANLRIPSIALGGMSLYFLPDRVLVHQEGHYGTVSYAELTAKSESTRFIESDSVPSDSEIVGHTWKFVNKNGGPDRRFNNNRKIPIARYGLLTLQSTTGLNLVFHTSRVQSAQEFATLLMASRQNHNETPKFSGHPRPAPVVSESVEAALRQLGLDKFAKEEDVKAAYRRMAMLYHPDKVAAMAPEFRALAEERMKEINAAYALLRSGW